MAQMTAEVTVIFRDDLIENMETAKRLIAAYPNVDLTALTRVASDRVQPVSARIAAIYTLGFIDDAGGSRELLERILADPSEPNDFRDHANEALNSLRNHD